MKTFRTISIAVIVLLGANITSAQSLFTNKDNVAINGYDVVNYFTTNTAVRGSMTYFTANGGANYYFVNEANLNAFKENPSKYLPQYGGYCAFAVAKMNKKVAVDPETFRVDDGKLYLFFNDFYEGTPFNTIIPWLGDEAQLEKLANTNWSALKGS